MTLGGKIVELVTVQTRTVSRNYNCIATFQVTRGTVISSTESGR
jgi:hypothetical protein